MRKGSCTYELHIRNAWVECTYELRIQAVHCGSKATRATLIRGQLVPEVGLARGKDPALRGLIIL